MPEQQLLPMKNFTFQHLPGPEHKIIQVPLLSVFDPDFTDSEYDWYVGSILAGFSPLPIYVVPYRSQSCLQHEYKIIGGSEFYRAICAMQQSPERIGVHLCENKIPKDVKIPTLAEFFQVRNISFEPKPT